MPIAGTWQLSALLSVFQAPASRGTVSGMIHALRPLWASVTFPLPSPYKGEGRWIGLNPSKRHKADPPPQATLLTVIVSSKPSYKEAGQPPCYTRGDGGVIVAHWLCLASALGWGLGGHFVRHTCPQWKTLCLHCIQDVVPPKTEKAVISTVTGSEEEACVREGL